MTQITDKDASSAWNAYADHWWSQEGSDGDFYHRNFIIPSVLRLLGDVKGKAVLDLACGTGTASRCLSRQGADVTGIDLAESMLAKARQVEEQERLGIEYLVCSASRLEGVEDESFDAVVCNMALMDIPDYHGGIQEAYRVLIPGGRFVFSILHPCFFTPASGWHKSDPKSKRNEDKLYWKVDNYFDRRMGRDLLHFHDGTGPIYFHRTLSDYLNAVIRARFRIRDVDELEPRDRVVDGWDCADMRRMAEFLVVAADKERETRSPNQGMQPTS